MIVELKSMQEKSYNKRKLKINNFRKYKVLKIVYKRFRRYWSIYDNIIDEI